MQIGIITLSLVVYAAVAWAMRCFVSPRAQQRFLLVASAWLALTAALAHAGFFAAEGVTPPRFLWLMLPTFALPVGLALSRAGAALAQAPIAVLVGSQVFRFPLELFMHRAATEGVMPVQMSYSGYNFDVLTGVSALAVAALSGLGRAPRWLIWAWNLLGTVLLLNILAIAVASLPQIRAFGDDPSRVNTWIAFFPFVWLPAALVGTAVLGHSLLWRRLLSHDMGRRAFASLS